MDCWALDVGLLDCWTLDVGRWTLDVGLLDVGRWTLDFRTSDKIKNALQRVTEKTQQDNFCLRLNTKLLNKKMPCLNFFSGFR
ncbi:MAG: hypothetical protein DYG98_05645 [Haliscomenobacteraceae bacterium CHB4]|nr:hypothetical protein [Haliscomenobacteraceae bacterium CHB4]